MDLFSSLSHSFSTFALDHLNFRPGEREKLAAYFLKALCPPLKRALPIKISDRDASESRRSFCSANFAPAENGKKENVEKGTHKKRERKKERTGTSSRLDERGRRRRILLLSADGKNRARAYGNSLFTRTRSPSTGSIIGEEHKSDERRSEKAERQGERTAGKKKNDEKAFETTIPASYSPNFFE